MYKLIITCFLTLFLMSCTNPTNPQNHDLDFTLPDEIITVDINDISDDLKTFEEGILSYKKAPEEINPLLLLSLEDKISQLFILDFRSMSPSVTTTLTPDVAQFLQTYAIGGLIYFGENITDADQVYQLNTALNEIYSANKRLPLFIGVDEEGGVVSRLGQKNIGITKLPSAYTLANTNTPSELESLAVNQGQEMVQLAFNMNFAPVLDVNTNASNPIIGNRAFSTDPRTAGQFGSAFAHGLEKAGILPVGKHYPGHGDTSGDSHLGEVIYEGDTERFLTVESVPFQMAIEKGLPAIMVGHIQTPNLTGDTLPATLSYPIITTYLRQSFHYKGLVITDSLQMKAITNHYEPEDVGIMAIQAGCDLLLMPDDFEATYQGLLQAVQSGIITEDRINDSLNRIYKLKKRLQ